MFADTSTAAFVVLKLVACANAAEVGKWTGNEFEHNYAMNDMLPSKAAKPSQNLHPKTGTQKRRRCSPGKGRRIPPCLIV